MTRNNPEDKATGFKPIESTSFTGGEVFKFSLLLNASSTGWFQGCCLQDEAGGSPSIHSSRWSLSHSCPCCFFWGGGNKQRSKLNIHLLLLTSQLQTLLRICTIFRNPNNNSQYLVHSHVDGKQVTEHALKFKTLWAWVQIISIMINILLYSHISIKIKWQKSKLDYLKKKKKLRWSERWGKPGSAREIEDRLLTTLWEQTHGPA